MGGTVLATKVVILRSSPIPDGKRPPGYLAGMRKSAWCMVLCLTTVARAQSPCSCTEDPKAPVVAPDTVFVLDSTMAVAYCGWIDRSGAEPRYSEFTLRWCGNQWPLLSADATLDFRITVLDKALVAEDFRILPTGKDLHMGIVLWRTHVIEGVYEPAMGEVVAKISEVPGDLHVITASEEDAIRKRLKALDPKKNFADEQLLGLLFLSAASEQRGAEKRFRNLHKRYLLDGAYAEQYHELLGMLDEVVADR